ncbi:nucleolar protein 12 [Tribolium madens]|uniref:nucleolar protein 12 n=1 Tax=Tribolium madens TaxID=41895 RepID=UPI001CF7212D|nr:nucleolar protein 12 [Tribolium madens]
MAAGSSVKKNRQKNPKNRTNKLHLVFDEKKRRDFLTGFHKRKLQRKKEAREKLERELKEERKRLKTEAKESYKKLVVSARPIPELETLLKEEYEDEDATVRIEELSTDVIAKESNWIGANQPICENEEESEVPGMDLKQRDTKVTRKFDSERDVKRLLKKEATKKVQKSKVFQMKTKIEGQKQRKKARRENKQKMKLKEKKRKRH